VHHAEFVHANPGDAASGGVTREARYPDAHHRLTRSRSGPRSWPRPRPPSALPITRSAPERARSPSPTAARVCVGCSARSAMVARTDGGHRFLAAW